jgi:hypothetical protein
LPWTGKPAKERCTSTSAEGIDATFDFVARSICRYGHDLRRAIIVGDGAAAFDMASRLARRVDLGYRVVDTVEADGQAASASPVLARIAAVLEREPVDEIFVTLPLDRAQPLIGGIVVLCEEQGITLRLLSSVADLRLGRAQVDELDGRPILSLFTGPPDSVALLVKHVLDVVLALAALLVLSPFLVLVGLAIKLDSPGPGLFVQDRVGFNGRRFRFYKFRTMVEGAEGIQAALEGMNEAAGSRLQDSRRPARHAGRSMDPKTQYRRAAEARQRGDRRHEPGRVAAAAAAGRHPHERPHPQEAHERQAGHHVFLAGGRARAGVRGMGQGRHAVHRQLVALARYQDSAADDSSRFEPPWCLLNHS